MFLIRHPKFLIALLLFLLLSGVSISWAEEGHFYWGYRIGHQSDRGDVTGRSLYSRLLGGYSIGRVSFDLGLGLGVSPIDEMGVEVEYAFPLGAFRLFVQAGWGIYNLRLESRFDEDDPIRLHGNGPDVGFGFDYFIRNRTSIGLGTSKHFVHYKRHDRLSRSLDSRTTVITARWNIYF